MDLDIKPVTSPKQTNVTDDPVHPLSRAEKDLQKWHEWKATGSKDILKSMLRDYDGVVHSFVSKYAHSGVPYPALEAEAKINAIKGFRTFDPSKGTQLNTHVTNYLQKGQRMVYENKALTRIPEHRATRISTFLSVQDFLKEKLGREPSMAELKDELAASHPIGKPEDGNHWSEAEIGRMHSELHKTLLASEDALQDIASQSTSRDQTLVDFVYYELKPDEKLVYEYLTGSHGKEMLDGINIAKKLNMTPSRVSRVRQKIANVFERYREK